MRHFLTTTLALTSLAIAQSSEPAAEKVVSGAMGIDFTTQYFFRGILQENQGIIAQPWVELGYGVYGGDADGLHDVSLTFGLWNSLHDGPTGGRGGIWYENDFYVGLAGGIGERVSVGMTYTSYYSPNATFGPVEEIAFSLGYDDKGQLIQSIESGLQPSVLVAIEFDGQADAGSTRGIYAQLGIEPSFAIGKLGEMDVTLAVPVTIGLSLSDYYEYGTGSDDFLGFFDVGVVASAPLSFLPPGAGPWDGSVALHAILLGDNNETVNVGDNSEFILSVGVSTTF